MKPMKLSDKKRQRRGSNEGFVFRFPVTVALAGVVSGDGSGEERHGSR